MTTRGPGGRLPRLLALAALPLLVGGCFSACDGKHLIDRAASGDMRGIHEAGELADSKIPSSRTPPPKLRDAYAAIKPHLSDEDPYKRLRALEALRRLSTRSPSIYRDDFRDMFDPLLSDTDAQIRWRAAWALGRMILSSEALRKAALDPDDRVAERAVWALGQARDDDARLQLLSALDRPALQKQTIRSLKRITGLRLGDDVEAWKAAARPKKEKKKEDAQ